jgi:hypothetical protein
MMTDLGYGCDAATFTEAEIYFNDFMKQLGWKSFKSRSASSEKLFVL